MKRLNNFIGGEFVAPQNGKYLDDFAPAIGEKIADIPDSDASDVEAAVRAAKAALPGWASLTLAERADWLDRIADVLTAQAQTVAELESLDTGKPFRTARDVDAARSISNFRFFADLIRNRKAETYEMSDAHNYVVFKPVGVVGLITPWNLPLYLLTWKIAPALAMGNTIVAKPSELTPLTADFLAQVVQQIGLPAGVLNIVHGTGPSVGSPLVSHPDVPGISFTGGTVTGAVVNSAAAPLFKKVSLELGGKNATIVFGDSDLDAIMAGVVRASFANQGQVCLCGSRIFVEQSIYAEFSRKFVAAVKALKIGDPKDVTTDFAAVISHQHKAKILSYIDLAQQEGGTILCGGANFPEGLDPKFEKGSWVAPTVVEGLSHTSRTATEEIFGPVVTLHSFEKEDEVIEYANAVKYGLAGSVWTSDLDKAKRVAERIETGMIWVNCWLHRDLRVPFGGVKQSGVGREGGHRSLEFFSESQNICLKLK